jgi:predicted RNase H-like nuclease
MPTILGIDAAWTASEPSGVALVQAQGTAWRCLAVAPSYEAFLSLASGRQVDWTQPSFAGNIPNIPEILEAAAVIAGDIVDVVALDMPVAKISISSRRCADNQISIEFGSRWCSAHTPHSQRPGSLGLALSTAFADSGYPIWTQREEHETRRLLEVYPHPALLSLLGRAKRVPYKISKARRYWPNFSVPQRIEALLAEYTHIRAALIRSFGDIGLVLPVAEAVACLGHLKRYEDSLDALVCAWVGAEHLAGRTLPLGDNTAAIWCPANVVLHSAYTRLERAGEGRGIE